MTGRTQEGFQLEPLRGHARLETVCRTGTSQGRTVNICPAQAITAGLDIGDFEVHPVVGVELIVRIALVERREIHVDCLAIVLEAHFEGVDLLASELQVGRFGTAIALGEGRSRQTSRAGRIKGGVAGAVQCREIEVETASLVALRGRGVEHQVINRLEAEHRGTGPLPFAEFGPGRTTREGRRRTVDHASQRGERLQRRVEDCRAERVGETGIGSERLLLMRVARTHCQHQLVFDDVEGVVGEDRPVIAALVKAGAIVARAVEAGRTRRRGQTLEAGEDRGRQIRTGRRSRVYVRG